MRVSFASDGYRGRGGGGQIEDILCSKLEHVYGVRAWLSTSTNVLLHKDISSFASPPPPRLHSLNSPNTFRYIGFKIITSVQELRSTLSSSRVVYSKAFIRKCMSKFPRTLYLLYLLHWNTFQAFNAECCKSLRHCYRETIAAGQNKKYCQQVCQQM